MTESPADALVRKLNATPVCTHCGRKHQGTAEEGLTSIDPEAAVYFDRDVANDPQIVDLCGPRFRDSSIIGLHAHYGFPNLRYVVYRWHRHEKLWMREIPTFTKAEAREDFQDLLIARLLSKIPVTELR